MTEIKGDRKHAFNLGQLVGRLSKIQIDNDNTPAYSRFSVSSLSKANFMSVANETISKLGYYYDSDNLHKYIPGGYELDDFVDDIDNRSPPTNWDISDEEVRYYYALGIAEAITYTDIEDDE